MNYLPTSPAEQKACRAFTPFHLKTLRPVELNKSSSILTLVFIPYAEISPNC